jgi:hypothetical protein
VAWKEELSRPLREANEFLTTVESELNSIASTGPPPLGALVLAGYINDLQLAPFVSESIDLNLYKYLVISEEKKPPR